VRVSVTHLSIEAGVTPTALKAALADAVKQAALSADPTILEPVMKVHRASPARTHFSPRALSDVLISLPPWVCFVIQLELMVDESSLGTVVGDIAAGRRGIVRTVRVLPQHRLIEAEAPLQELLGYSTLFRSLTRGSGSFTMEFLRYGTPSPPPFLLKMRQVLKSRRPRRHECHCLQEAARRAA
jgi:translation elongation factor EF-G